MMMFKNLLNLFRPARASAVSVYVPLHNHRKQPEWWKFWDDPTRNCHWLSQLSKTALQILSAWLLVFTSKCRWDFKVVLILQRPFPAFSGELPDPLPEAPPWYSPHIQDLLTKYGSSVFLWIVSAWKRERDYEKKTKKEEILRYF